MKTSIDIPDSLYRQAKIRAMENGQTLRELLVEALERALFPSSIPARTGEDHEPPHHDVDDLGVPVLRRHAKDGIVVSNELVNELREREGI